MRFAKLVTTCLVLAATVSMARADAWPLADLKASGKGSTALGDWSLAAFGGRNDFPYLVDRKDLEMVEPGRFVLPERAAGEVRINDKGLNVRSAGMQNKEAIDTLLSALVFASKEAGTYAFSGRLTNLWCDNNKASKDTLKWAVLIGKADGKKFKVVVTGMTGNGENVDLAEQASLKAVSLAQGETLVFTLFKPGSWGAAGGDITAVNVDKATATTEPAK